MLSGIFASVFASQLYLVSGIRKLRSEHFMNGRLLVDNLAYLVCQAEAGNRDYLKIIRPQRLPSLLRSRVFLLGRRLTAILTAVVELTLGLISPRRIMSLNVATLGLLAMATAHPLPRPVL